MNQKKALATVEPFFKQRAIWIFEKTAVTMSSHDYEINCRSIVQSEIIVDMRNIFFTKTSIQITVMQMIIVLVHGREVRNISSPLNATLRGGKGASPLKKTN